jgi:SNF2 family DNA or RNA helicase
MVEHVLKHPRASLFVDMGLGKTSATLFAIAEMYRGRVLDKLPVLVIAPKNVAKGTWPNEVKKWNLPISIVTLAGCSEAERNARLAQSAMVYTINLDMISWLIERLGNAWPFGMVVIDESTRLKGYRKRGGTRRALELSHRAFAPGLRWLNLTGTPTPNGLLDLWAQCYFLDHGARLGDTYDAYRSRWFELDQTAKRGRKNSIYADYVPYPWAQAQITDRVRDICLSIEAKDHFDLKAPIIVTRSVDLPPAARKVYNDMVRKLRAELLELTRKSTVTAVSAGVKTMKCLQIASGAVYDDGGKVTPVHDAKIEELKSIIEECAGAPLIVVYFFKPDLARLKAAFPHGRVLSTPDDEAAFNEGRVPLLFLHTSGGHGLNLQYGGNRMAFFTQWWDNELYSQTVGRIGPVRQFQAGFDRPVYIYHIVARDTIDELVIHRRETKQSVMQILMESLK